MLRASAIGTAFSSPTMVPALESDRAWNANTSGSRSEMVPRNENQPTRDFARGNQERWLHFERRTGQSYFWLNHRLRGGLFVGALLRLELELELERGGGGGSDSAFRLRR